MVSVSLLWTSFYPKPLSLLFYDLHESYRWERFPFILPFNLSSCVSFQLSFISIEFMFNAFRIFEKESWSNCRHFIFWKSYDSEIGIDKLSLTLQSDWFFPNHFFQGFHLTKQHDRTPLILLDTIFIHIHLWPFHRAIVVSLPQKGKVS